MRMNEYDVIVVGGGPGGLSAAYRAAQDGVKVAVLERSREIGYPIHTSGGSWIDELRQLDIPDRFMHPITEGVFLSTNAQAIFQYDEPQSCVLDVRGLYQYLAELASSAGAEIFVNTHVTEPIFESGSIHGVAARKMGRPVIFRAPLVIDASGFSASVARKLGLADGCRRFGVGAEYDLYAPEWPQNRVAFLFGSGFAPSGYGWVFPHRNKRVRVGVGLIKPQADGDPREFLEGILANSNLLDGHLQNVSRIEFHSGSIPSEIYLKKTFADGVMVVGDAAGLISTLLGEGIRFAIDIGRIAGRVAAKAVHAKRFDAKFLSEFERAWRQKYDRVFKIGAYVNRRLSEYSDQRWDDKIRLLATIEPDLLVHLLKGQLSARHLLRSVVSNPNLIMQVLKNSIWKNA